MARYTERRYATVTHIQDPITYDDQLTEEQVVTAYSNFNFMSWEWENSGQGDWYNPETQRMVYFNYPDTQLLKKRFVSSKEYIYFRSSTKTANRGPRTGRFIYLYSSGCVMSGQLELPNGYAEDISKMTLNAYNPIGAFSTNQIWPGAVVTGNLYGTTNYILKVSLTMESHTGAHKPYLEAVYEDVSPYAANMAPASGFVDEHQQSTFTWSFSYNTKDVAGILSQKTALFQWRGTDNVIHDIAVGADQYCVVPANTFPNGTVDWRVTVTSDDNVQGAASQWCRISTVDVLSKAEAVSPNGQYADGSEAIYLQWKHLSDLGSTQRAYDIQVMKGGQWTALASHAVSPTTMHTVPAHTLPPGKCEWRVRTYNSDDLVGEWSAAASFYVIEAPTATVSQITPGTALPSVYWTATGQQAFQVQCLQNGAAVYQSGTVAGGQKAYKLPDFLEDGQYLFRLRVQNKFGLWSLWSEYGAKITTVKPQKPGLLVTPIKNGLRLQASNVGPDVTSLYFLRDGIPVAKDTGRFSFDDYSATGRNRYAVRAVTQGNCFADSEELQVEFPVKNILLAPVDSPADVISLVYRRGSRPGYSASLSVTGEAVHFAGRAFPVYDASEFVDAQKQYEFSFRERSDYRTLESLMRNGKTVLIRDCFGEKTYGVITGLSSSTDTRTTDFTMVVTQVDYQERIAYGEV